MSALYILGAATLICSYVGVIKADSEFSKIFSKSVTQANYAVQEELKKFFVHTLPDFVRQSSGELEILKTPEELKKLKNFVSDYCECESFTCGCCAHVEQKEINLNESICVNVTYLSKDYGISLVMTFNSHIVFNESVSARNPPPFCIGVLGFKKPSPVVKHIIQLCVRIYDIHVTASDLHACIRLECNMMMTSVAKFDVGCLYISRRLGKWIMRSEDNSNECSLDDIPACFNISYHLIGDKESRDRALEIPGSSRGNGLCNETDWLLILTWPTPKRDTLSLLTWEFHQDRYGNTNATLYFDSIGKLNATRFGVEKGLFGLEIPKKIMQCCKHLVSQRDDDLHDPLSFTLSFQGEVRPEDLTHHDFLWIFGFVSLVLIVTLTVLFATIRCCRACCC